MTEYERSLYRAEIAQLRQEVKRQRVLLELCAEAARFDHAEREVPSGQDEQTKGQAGRA